ncbi:hypothetical protein [Algoriphagus boritolerans]|uniref:hypothetical protein n=1 Tax=Algoriphagus boritolerans TaxID=308111 RepID=UPI000A92BE28
MGFIPLFLTVGGACLLFFLTVKNTMQRKLNLQRELLTKLGLAHPEIGLILGEIADPDTVLESLKKINAFGENLEKDSGNNQTAKNQQIPV